MQFLRMSVLSAGYYIGYYAGRLMGDPLFRLIEYGNMDNDLANYFMCLTREIFAFLGDQYSFNDQDEFLDNRTGIVGIVFKGRNLGIELSWDARDQCVDCIVGELIQSDWPQHNFIDGRRVKESLFKYALCKGYRGNVTPNRTKTDLRKFIDDNLRG